MSIVSSKDLYQSTSIKSIEKHDIRPLVEKETTEPIKKKFTTITTLERLTNPINSSMYLDDRNIVSTRNSDIFDDKTEESLSSTNITIDENLETGSYVTKLEKEKQELERLKSSYEERVNAKMPETY